jgi:hypothetical protein
MLPIVTKPSVTDANDLFFKENYGETILLAGADILSCI